jgi:hypothetical protein
MSFLSNIKLSIAQWAGIMASAAIGVLVFALRLQGSRLHRAQTDLLKEQFGREMDRSDAKVEAAKKKWADALQAYEDAK